MITKIKELVQANKEKREKYVKEMHSVDFQTALLKIKNILRQYDPSQPLLKVEISTFVGAKNQEFCQQLIDHLEKENIPCYYSHQAAISNEDNYTPSYDFIVFHF